MNMLKLICLASIVIGFSSCKKKNISKDEIYSNKNISIELLNVSDGRCPEGLACFWEGNAAVDLRVKEGSQSVDFTLNTYNMYLKDTIIFDYKIEMLSVLPYPVQNVITTVDDFEIELEITKQ